MLLTSGSGLSGRGREALHTELVHHTSRTAGPHGDPCQRIGKQAYEHLLLCGRFFQRNGAIGRLELSTMSSLCRRSTPMERGCATRRWANAVERRTPSPEREAAISLATCARAHSAHAIGAARVARGVDGSQRLRRPGRPGTQARSAVRRAPPRRAAPCAERVTRGDAGSCAHGHARSGCPTVPPAPTCTTGRLLPSSAILSKKGHQSWP